jgi:hypothetical protein
MFGTNFRGVKDESYPGERFVFTFENGRGASVVRGEYTYGGPEGLWELAVLSKDGDLDYDTPITYDVLGHLTDTEVGSILVRISMLTDEVCEESRKKREAWRNEMEY